MSQIREESCRVVEFALRDILPRYCANSWVDVARWVDGLVADVRVRMLSRLASETTGEETVKLPRTWWDGFKVSCLPRWLSRGFKPPRYREITIRRVTREYRVCPHIAVPDTARHYRFLVGEPTANLSRWPELGEVIP